jgi:hypothetical protein
MESSVAIVNPDSQGYRFRNSTVGLRTDASSRVLADLSSDAESPQTERTGIVEGATATSQNAAVGGTGGRSTVRILVAAGVAPVVAAGAAYVLGN